MSDEELIKKWLADGLSPEEEAQLQGSAEFARLKKIWEHLAVATPPTLDVAEELARFHARATPVANKTITIAWHRRWLAVAASVVLVAVASVLWQSAHSPSPTVLHSEGLKTHYLPDSSTVVLNADSELRYTAETWATHRQVTLQGEGFFQVRHGSAFQVHTQEGTVQVLGTVFQVKQRPQYYQVICYQGSVGVATAQRSDTLAAGEGVQQIGAEVSRFQQAQAQRPGWLEGRSTFVRVPYALVLAELERLYQITIETQGLATDRTFSGNIPNDNLTVALEAITLPGAYLFEQHGDTVLIYSEEH